MTDAPISYDVDLWAPHDATQYAQQWTALMPRGTAWNPFPGSVQQDVILALAQIWGNPVDANAALLLTQESDPRTMSVILLFDVL